MIQRILQKQLIIFNKCTDIHGGWQVHSGLVYFSLGFGYFKVQSQRNIGASLMSQHPPFLPSVPLDCNVF